MLLLLLFLILISARLLADPPRHVVRQVTNVTIVIVERALYLLMVKLSLDAVGLIPHANQLLINVVKNLQATVHYVFP